VRGGNDGSVAQMVVQQVEVVTNIHFAGVLEQPAVDIWDDLIL